MLYLIFQVYEYSEQGGFVEMKTRTRDNLKIISYLQISSKKVFIISFTVELKIDMYVIFHTPSSMAQYGPYVA